MLGFELSTSWSLTWTAEPPLPSIHAVLCPRLTPSLVSDLLGPRLILSERKYTLDMRVCLFFGMLVSGFLCMVCLSRSYYSAYFLCLSITASPQSIQLIFPAPLYFILFIIIVSDANSRLYRTDNVAVDHFFHVLTVWVFLFTSVCFLSEHTNPNSLRYSLLIKAFRETVRMAHIW